MLKVIEIFVAPQMGVKPKIDECVRGSFALQSIDKYKFLKF